MSYSLKVVEIKIKCSIIKTIQFNIINSIIYRAHYSEPQIKHLQHNLNLWFGRHKPGGIAKVLHVRTSIPMALQERGDERVVPA